MVDYRCPIFGTAREFFDLFISRYGRIPDYTEAGCAAAGAIYQQVVERMGLMPPLQAEEKEVLKDQLWESEFETFFGRISLSRTGNLQ